MRIAGRRADGALHLTIGSGMGVVLKGFYVTPPLEEDAIAAMGPWEPAADNSFEERTRIERILNCASLTRMEYFQLAAKKESAVALDQYHSLEQTKDDKKPVSEVAQAAQAGDTAAPPAIAVMNLMPVDPESPEGRKQRRSAMRDKIRAAQRSKGKTADTLDDKDISDEDLFAMAKALGVTLDDTPSAVTLIDNANRYQRLLSTTTIAKHMHLAGGEHPFQYCIDNVIPAMAKDGKEPDDPEAFCAWWKNEGPGSE